MDIGRTVKTEGPKKVQSPVPQKKTERISVPPGTVFNPNKVSVPKVPVKTGGQ